MNYECTAVALFHEACGVPVREQPNQPLIEEHEYRLRLRLVNEESRELMHALSVGDLVETADGIADTMVVTAGTCVQLGCRPTVEHSMTASINLVQDAHHVLSKSVQTQNWREVAVGAVMMQIICRGIASIYGIPYGAVFDAVQASNMDKRTADGTVMKDAGGKILKPTQWPAPQPWEPPTERIKRVLAGEKIERAEALLKDATLLSTLHLARQFAVVHQGDGDLLGERARELLTNIDSTWPDIKDIPVLDDEPDRADLNDGEEN